LENGGFKPLHGIKNDKKIDYSLFDMNVRGRLIPLIPV
jgi:hypothetical protein